MKKKLCLIAIILIGILFIPSNPEAVASSYPTGVRSAYTQDYQFGDSRLHRIRITMEVVVNAGDTFFDSGYIPEASYWFPKDGVIKSVLITWGGANVYAVPEFFAFTVLTYNGWEFIKIDYAHMPYYYLEGMSAPKLGGYYEQQKNGEMWFTDLDIPVEAGWPIWLGAWVKKQRPDGDTWFSTRVIVFYEETKRDK